MTSSSMASERRQPSWRQMLLRRQRQYSWEQGAAQAGKVPSVEARGVGAVVVLRSLCGQCLRSADVRQRSADGHAYSSGLEAKAAPQLGEQTLGDV